MINKIFNGNLGRYDNIGEPVALAVKAGYNLIVLQNELWLINYDGGAISANIKTSEIPGWEI